MLRFEVHPVIQDMLEIQRADHFLCYVSRSALSLDMLEIQRADHSLCCVLRSMRFKTYVRITEGGPILIHGLRFTQNSYFGT